MPLPHLENPRAKVRAVTKSADHDTVYLTPLSRSLACPYNTELWPRGGAPLLREDARTRTRAADACRRGLPILRAGGASPRAHLGYGGIGLDPEVVNQQTSSIGASRGERYASPETVSADEVSWPGAPPAPEATLHATTVSCCPRVSQGRRVEGLPPVPKVAWAISPDETGWRRCDAPIYHTAGLEPRGRGRSAAGRIRRDRPRGCRVPATR